MKEIIAFYPITKPPGVHSTDAETPNVYAEPPFLLSVGDSVAYCLMWYPGTTHLWYPGTTKRALILVL